MLLNVVGIIVGTVTKGNRFLVEHRKLDEKIDPVIVCLPAGQYARAGCFEERDVERVGYTSKRKQGLFEGTFMYKQRRETEG